jgi:hypothetical protein
MAAPTYEYGGINNKLNMMFEINPTPVEIIK